MAVSFHVFLSIPLAHAAYLPPIVTYSFRLNFTLTEISTKPLQCKVAFPSADRVLRALA
jgi:hypothetical protein